MNIVKSVMKRYLILIFLPVLILGCSEDNCPSTDDYDYNTIKIAGVYDLSGEESTFGTETKEIIEYTLNEIRSNFQEAGFPKTIEYSYIDTESDPDKAVEATKAKIKEGYRIFIGSMNDAETKAVRNYLNSEGAILITNNSESEEISISDNIYRVCLSDKSEAEAMAAISGDKKIDALVPFYFENLKNEKYFSSLKAEFNSIKPDGGKIYSPVEVDMNSFNTEGLSNVRERLLTALGDYPTGNVAVFYIGGDETDLVLDSASKDKVFSSVQWFGSGAIASSAENASQSIKLFLEEVGMIFPKPGQTNHHDNKDLSDITSLPLLASHDACRTVCNAAAKVYRNDIDVLKSIFESESSKYFGLSGKTVLNEFGDRKFGIIGLYEVSASGTNHIFNFNTENRELK